MRARLVPLVLLAACGGAPPDDAADVLFTDVTGFGVQGPTSLAVKGDRVVALGADADALRGDATKVVSLAGRYVMPGATDDHTHLVAGSFVFDKLLMVGVAGMEAIVRATRAYVNTHPEDDWIVGYGWIAPLTDDASGVALDEVEATRPVVLFDSSGHAVLVNSEAMRRAGIDADTPDPEGCAGCVARDDDGAPTGVLYEAAIQLVAPVVIEAFGDEALQANVAKYATTFAEGGITSVAEILAVPGVDLGRPQVLSALEAAGELPIRVNYHMPAFTLADLDRVDDVRDAHDGALVHFTGVKIWVDGTTSSGEAWSLDPVVGSADDHGVAYFQPEQIAAFVRAAEEGGYALKAHCNGDGAVDAFLDALELVQGERGELTQPYALEHVVLIAPPDYARMAALGVVASVQPSHVVFGGASEQADLWADGRFDRTWDFRGLLDAGVPLALGTDWPVWPSPSVLANLQAGVASSGRHQISVDEGLEGYTRGSATAVGREDELGCLDVGCLADLVVLETDPHTVEPTALSRQAIVGVWVGGRLVHGIE